MSEEQLDVREQTVQEACAQLLTDMALLRDFPVPPSDAEPSAVHQALRDDLRGRLDRAEQLMADIKRHRRRARRSVRQLSAAYDEAYDTALEKLSRRAVGRDYEGVHDREVQARTAASMERRKVIAAERVLDLVEEAEDVMTSMFFGLRDIRRELLASLDYLPWRASIEN